MADITPIRKPFAPDDAPATLRRIADELEAGEHGLVTTCLVVMGHTEGKVMDDGGKLRTDEYVLYACGPRCDSFTVRGLLLTVATRPL